MKTFLSTTGMILIMMTVLMGASLFAEEMTKNSNPVKTSIQCESTELSKTKPPPEIQFEFRCFSH